MPSFNATTLLLGLLFCAVSGVNAQTNLVSISQELAKQFATTDPLFKEPYIDTDEWRDKPVRHRYVHGGFTGTGARFSFYFPAKENYQGRFFQYITPFPDNENLSQGATGEEDKIGFAVSHGAYFIETNEGGPIDFSKPMAADPTIGAYRVNATSAQFSRIVAAQLYGKHRTYGYCFGGSGGASERWAAWKTPRACGMEPCPMCWVHPSPFPMFLPSGCTPCGC